MSKEFRWWEEDDSGGFFHYVRSLSTFEVAITLSCYSRMATAKKGLFNWTSALRLYPPSPLSQMVYIRAGYNSRFMPLSTQRIFPPFLLDRAFSHVKRLKNE